MANHHRLENWTGFRSGACLSVRDCTAISQGVVRHHVRGIGVHRHHVGLLRQLGLSTPRF